MDVGVCGRLDDGGRLHHLEARINSQLRSIMTCPMPYVDAKVEFLAVGATGFADTWCSLNRFAMQSDRPSPRLHKALLESVYVTPYIFPYIVRLFVMVCVAP